MTTKPQPTTETLEPIYVASRASIPERGEMWRGFRAGGTPITSSWIDEDGEGQTGDFGVLWLRIANEIRLASALVLYAMQSDFPLKGALTEAGIALGMGKPVIVCLPDLGVLPRNYRPIGSWIAHPLVTRCDDINVAVRLATHTRISPASAAPVVDDHDAGPLTDAQVHAWLEAHKNDPTDLAQANRVEWLFRKKLAISVTSKAKEWLLSYDERIEQGGKGAQDMERLYGKEAAFHREVIRAVETLALEPSTAAATAAPERLFEAKLLGFGEGDRIRLCEPCLKRAIDEHLVSFSSALPAAPVAKSNREPHAFQEHPHYPNYCAFAVGDEDYCKRETDNVIHQVATAAPVEQKIEK